MPSIDPGLALSQFVGSLPTFIAVILAWLHSNARISDINTNLNKRIDDTNTRFDKRFDDINHHFEKRFDDVDKRLADLREFIRAENEATRAAMRRMEEIIDARLSHLEERDR